MTQLNQSINIFGYQVSARGISGDIEHACRMIVSGRYGQYMACANPHSLVVASRDASFQSALQQSDLLIPDGAGIALASRSLYATTLNRVAGFEFFYELTKTLDKSGGARYFFLGSSDNVLHRIVTRLNCEFPSITVCGTLSPPFATEFSDTENKSIVSAINASKPDVLWVGMTAPKQEKWIYQNREILKIPFTGAIGAVFDFYAGTKKRSSDFWQALGLEWFPRFLREPRRLWERNMKSTPIFLYWIAREKYKTLYVR